LIGVLIWVLIFFEVSLMLFGLKLPDPGVSLEASFLIPHFILIALIIAFSSVYYFKGKGVKKGLGEGFFLGVVFLITGIILDAIITVPLFIKDYGFFLRPDLLASFVMGLIISSLVGALSKK
jgi:hypothetical protein